MKRFIIVLILLQSVALQASGSDLLQQLAKDLGGITSFQSKFTQLRQIVVLPVPLFSEGEFEYERGGQIVWRTVHPVASKTVIAPTGVKAVDASGRERPVPGSRYIAELMLSLFSGDIGALSSRFSIQVTGDTDVWSVALTPVDLAVAEHVKMITVSGGDAIDKISIQDANGDQLEIAFFDTLVERD